jgi:hypothetical protein
MIKNRKILEEFEKQLIAEEKVDFFKNLQIYEAMYQEAVELGVLPLKDPFDGVEDDIRLAKILNQLSQKESSKEHV